jgi:cell division septum initiation protein DivIVA
MTEMDKRDFIKMQEEIKKLKKEMKELKKLLAYATQIKEKHKDYIKGLCI